MGAQSLLRYRENSLFQKLGIFFCYIAPEHPRAYIVLNKDPPSGISVYTPGSFCCNTLPPIVTTRVTVADLGKTEKVCQK